MQTRLFAYSLAFLLPFASAALAQDTTEGRLPAEALADDFTGPLPPLHGSIACYKLIDEPNFCVPPDVRGIVNYTIPFNVIDLNGAWIDQGGVRPYIYVYSQPNTSGGYTIAVDLSLVNRPDGFGAFVDGSNLLIVFPDDRDYTGKIENNGRTIRWSNNTVWNKL